VTEGLDPGEPVEDLTYDWADAGPGGGDLIATRLPRTLLEAVDAFAADPLTQKVFSEQFIDNYIGMKNAEWDDYHGRVSEWERATYLAMF
jgi:glutamine synthetase